MMLAELLAKHGVTVEADKAKALEKEFAEQYKPAAEFAAINADLTSVKERLAAADEQISKFKDLDVDTVKQQAADWEQKAHDAEKQMNALRFDHALDSALSGAKAKNAKLVKKLLEPDKMKLTDGGIVGLAEQLEKLKASEDSAFLFEAEQPDKPPQFSAPAAGTHLPKEGFPFHFTGVREKPKNV